MQASAPFPVLSEAPPIGSLLIKPVSALCNLDCRYCFYLDRTSDPYQGLKHRKMPPQVLERLVEGYLRYSAPQSTFAFQGGEPTLAGLEFYQTLVRFQQHYGRGGQSVSNSIQTNGTLLDEAWCSFFREYQWLVGLSLDGPQELHDRYRVNKAGHSTWAAVMKALKLMRQEKVEFNVLCVLSQSNVERPKEIYRFYKSLGVDNIQYIPLSEFGPNGEPVPEAITPQQYGRFLLETFDLWWPDRRKIRIRGFDNLAEAVAGLPAGSCTLGESCDSYAVVEYNGDVYPCDFFVEDQWKLGNVMTDSWPQIAGRAKRAGFARKKQVPHEACQQCEWQGICQQGCPKFRQGRHGRFEDLDYFCESYKMVFAHTTGPLRQEVRRLFG